MFFDSNLKLVEDLSVTNWVSERTRPWPVLNQEYRGIGWVIPEGFESYISIQNYEPRNSTKTFNPLDFSRLILHLLQFTKYPGSCLMALWEGFGWNTKKDLGLEHTEVKYFRMPNRSYFLFEGPLIDAVKIGHKNWGLFFPEIPNYIWPQDKSWILVKEIDYEVILIGGSEELISSIENLGCFTTQRFDLEQPMHEISLATWIDNLDFEVERNDESKSKIPKGIIQRLIKLIRFNP